MYEKSTKPFIGYMTVRLFSHATEDLDKVMEAVRRIFPPECSGNIEFKKTKLKGHHGNPIVILETKIRKAEVISGFIQKLSEGLSSEDKERLLRRIDLHIERGNLYLRLDKQAALYGELRLENSDPIRICIHFRRRWASKIPEACQKLGITP